MRHPENILLMNYMLRNVTLLQKARETTDSLRVDLIDATLDPVGSFIWQAIYGVYAKSNRLPSALVVEAELRSRMEILNNNLTVQFIQAVANTWKKMLHSREEPLEPVIGDQLLEAALKEVIAVRQQNKYKAIQHDPDRIFEWAEETALAGKTATVQTADPRTFPLLHPDKYLVESHRRTTGLNFWDELSGGICPGEVWGLLAPTGGGKTLITISMACEWALRHDTVYLCSYEEPTKGDISQRIWSYFTHINISEFRDKAYGKLPDHIKAEMAKYQAHVANHLTVVDMSGAGDMRDSGTGGAQEIIDVCELGIKEGKPPKLVMVDWLGCAVKRYMNANGLDAGNIAEFGNCCETFVDRLSSYGKKQGICFLITHQLNSVAAQKSSNVRMTSHEALGWKAFGDKMEGCYTISPRCKTTNVTRLFTSKARMGALKIETLIRMDGAHSRFEAVDGLYIPSPTGSGFILRAQVGAFADPDDILKNRMAEDGYTPTTPYDITKEQA